MYYLSGTYRARTWGHQRASLTTSLDGLNASRPKRAAGAKHLEDVKEGKKIRYRFAYSAWFLSGECCPDYCDKVVVGCCGKSNQTVAHWLSGSHWRVLLLGTGSHSHAKEYDWLYVCWVVVCGRRMSFGAAIRLSFFVGECFRRISMASPAPMQNVEPQSGPIPPI